MLIKHRLAAATDESVFRSNCKTKYDLHWNLLYSFVSQLLYFIILGQYSAATNDYSHYWHKKIKPNTKLQNMK